mmetsp:Transcript_13419/g.37110  ORF Transcript_13419/g.37110 Transcript_13419/m.37110 type:complete len:209 (+) Transcript_13419:934-1560(+)
MGSNRLCSSICTSTFFLAAAAIRIRCSSNVLTGGLVIRTCIPRSTQASAISRCVSSGVKTIAQSPGWKLSAAGRKDCGSTTPSLGNVSMTEGSMPSYTSPITRFMCARISGSFLPFTPHMPSRPSLPRERRSRQTRPTMPVDLSEFAALPPTKPVVYSPVPIIRQPGGPRTAAEALLSVRGFFAGGPFSAAIANVCQGRKKQSGEFEP